MRSFFNDRDSLVTEAIDGLIAASGGRVTRLDAASHARVVLRTGWDKSKVAVVSGGGSGHEPSHAGLVGKGLLTAAGTAATCSPRPASMPCWLPSSRSPDRRAVSSSSRITPATGSNFGLAAERAKAMGLEYMVIVADDIALPMRASLRGVAGTIFVHRVAGAMSEAGAALADIATAASEAAAATFTIGAARDTCTVPGGEKHARMVEGQVEIGLGIHGEPGIEIATPATSRELVTQLAATLGARTRDGARYAALVDNLGGLSGARMRGAGQRFDAHPARRPHRPPRPRRGDDGARYAGRLHLADGTDA